MGTFAYKGKQKGKNVVITLDPELVKRRKNRA